MADIDFQPTQGNIDFQPMGSDVSMPESFGRGAANNFPLAPQVIAAAEPGSYSQNLQNWNQKAQAAKAANPISYGAGAVTGAAAPLAIPIVGETMEAAPMATNAALGAANAISNTDVLQQPKEALKQAGEGAVTGGILGKVGSELLPGAGAAEALENKASTQAVKTLGLRPGMLAHLEPEELQDLGKFARDADLVQGDTAGRLAKAQDLKQQVGAQIGEMGADVVPVNSADLDAHLQPLLDQAAKYSEIDDPSFQKDAKALTGAVNAIKSLGRPTSISRAGEVPEHTMLEQVKSSLVGPRGGPLTFTRPGEGTLPNIESNPISFSQLQELKNTYGQRAFNPDHTVANQTYADIYGKIKDLMNHMVDSSPSEYKDALTNYKNLSDIETGLTKQLGIERGGGSSGAGGFGVMGAVRRLPGPLRAVAGVAGAITGHPIIPIAAALPELTSPARHVPMLENAAKAIPGLSHMTQQELNDYLTSKFGGSNAQ